MVEIDHVQDALDRLGEAYLERVFTPGERLECGRDAARLAERFAAKEAVMKALNVSEGVPWGAIATRRAGQNLEVRLTAEAATVAARRGIGRIDVSVCHQVGHATAVALAEAA